MTHHHLAAEEVNDNSGPAIMLTQQEGIEDPHVVLIHPWQLRAICEQFGIIASDTVAEKTIVTLKRRMHLLRDRIENLHNYLTNHSDHRHADLSYEVTYATACIDLADEFCADLEDPEPVTYPRTTTSESALEPRRADQTAVAVQSGQPSLI